MQVTITPLAHYIGAFTQHVLVWDKITCTLHVLNLTGYKLVLGQAHQLARTFLALLLRWVEVLDYRYFLFRAKLHV